MQELQFITVEPTCECEEPFILELVFKMSVLEGKTCASSSEDSSFPIVRCIAQTDNREPTTIPADARV